MNGGRKLKSSQMYPKKYGQQKLKAYLLSSKRIAPRPWNHVLDKFEPLLGKDQVAMKKQSKLCFKVAKCGA